MIDNYDSFTYIIVQYFEQLGQSLKVIRNDEYTLPTLLHELDELNELDESDELTHLTNRDGKLDTNLDAIIIGPGPGRPEEAGITLDIIRHFAGRTPIFGICLGLQAIAMAYGAHIIQARTIMHGRVSKIYHCHEGVFAELPCPVAMTRYHSLVVDKNTLPDTFVITAWTPSTELLEPTSSASLCVDTIDYDTVDNNNIASNDIKGDKVNVDKHKGDIMSLGMPFDNEIMAIRHRYLDLEGVQFHPESILSDAGLHLLNNFLLQHGLVTFTQ